MKYFLRATFILSFIALVVCSFMTWQQWSPFTPGYPDHRNFLRTVDHVTQAAKFLFFATALVEAWLGQLDKRISALALGAFMLERFGQLGGTEKYILLGVAVANGLVLVLLLRQKAPLPDQPHGTTGNAGSVSWSGDGSRLHSPADDQPTGVAEPQPNLRWTKAKRLMTFIAFGDLDARRAQKGHAR